MPNPGSPLQARSFGPYTVEKKACDLNYIITTPDRRKQKQLYHINMLKEYADRDNSNVAPVNVIKKQGQMNCEEIYCEELNFNNSDPTCSKLQNSDILKDLDKKLSHLDQAQREKLNISTYFQIFQQGLIKSIMILILRVQNQLNNIHIE